MWFPFLPTDRLRSGAAPDERPLALVERRGGALCLAAADRHALALGLLPGLPLADARARVPALLVEHHDPDADRRLLHALAEGCERFTPAVALDPPDGLVLDVTGCAALFGGEAVLHRLVPARLGRPGLAVRAAIAGTPGAARALARHGPSAVVPPGEEAGWLRPLPVAALEVEPAILDALRRAGLRSLGDLMDRPHAGFTARFGPGLARRLARMLGEEDERIVPLRAPPAILAQRQFAEPMTHLGGLQPALLLLVREAARQMEAQGTGGRRFEASFFRSDGATRRVVAESGQPLRDPATILRLFAERFEALRDPLDPGFGFDALRFTVPVTEPLEARQHDLDGRAQGEADATVLLDRLVARLGRDRVLRFGARDTHDPDREARWLAVTARGSYPWRAPEGGEPPLRPVFLFRPPQEIRALAEVPDAPPRLFTWRRQVHKVTRAEGPERIAPEWWRDEEGRAGAIRDYYRLEDEAGRRFWVFRLGLYGEGDQPPWFLHGLFA